MNADLKLARAAILKAANPKLTRVDAKNHSRLAGVLQQAREGLCRAVARALRVHLVHVLCVAQVQVLRIGHARQLGLVGLALLVGAVAVAAPVLPQGLGLPCGEVRGEGVDGLGQGVVVAGGPVVDGVEPGVKVECVELGTGRDDRGAEVLGSGCSASAPVPGCGPAVDGVSGYQRAQDPEQGADGFWYYFQVAFYPAVLVVLLFAIIDLMRIGR